MTMSVHDACEAWAEGRISLEQAIALTGEVVHVTDEASLRALCRRCGVALPDDPRQSARIEGPNPEGLDTWDPMSDPVFALSWYRRTESLRKERWQCRGARDLARELLVSAGWPADYGGVLLDEAQNVDDVLRALRGAVRVVRSHEEAHATEELRSLAQDLVRQRFPGVDTRDACFRAGKSSTAEIVAGLRRLLQGEGPDGLFPGRRPLPESAASVRYPVEDGPGASDHVRLEVLAMRGTARSTVAVIDERSGKSLAREVVEHVEEAAAAGRAVEQVIRARREGA